MFWIFLAVVLVLAVYHEGFRTVLLRTAAVVLVLIAVLGGGYVLFNGLAESVRASKEASRAQAEANRAKAIEMCERKYCASATESERRSCDMSCYIKPVDP